jgi:hypothetical protein
MREIYRVKYKQGDVELDIESSDKEYIDKKLAELRVSNQVTPGKNGDSQRRNRRKKSAPTDRQIRTDDGQVADAVLAQIIASVNDADNYDDIAKYVLDRADRTPRILMCFYFAHQHQTDPAMTTGDVERFTSQLGVKIAQPNVAKVIRQSAGKYLTADRVRRRGHAVRYKINRRGIAAFEEIVAGGKATP